jgi:hypothetical protein
MIDFFTGKHTYRYAELNKEMPCNRTRNGQKIWYPEQDNETQRSRCKK